MEFRERAALYWRDRSDAGHRKPEAAWLALQAQELKVHFPQPPGAILEIACGAGDLFPFLARDVKLYVGADLSPAMLRRFRSETGERRVLQADAVALPFRDAAFDLVLSNGLVQYLPVRALLRHLADTRRVVRPGGLYVAGSIPDRELRLWYYAGALRSERTASCRRLFRNVLGRLLKNDDGIGQWYSRAQLARLAGEAGFACETYSSTTLEYRYNAVLRLRPS